MGRARLEQVGALGCVSERGRGMGRARLGAGGWGSWADAMCCSVPCPVLCCTKFAFKRPICALRSSDQCREWSMTHLTRVRPWAKYTHVACALHLPLA